MLSFKHIVGGAAIIAGGYFAKKWLDGEVAKSRELYGDDYTVTDTVMDKFEEVLKKLSTVVHSVE